MELEHPVDLVDLGRASRPADFLQKHKLFVYAGWRRKFKCETGEAMTRTALNLTVQEWQAYRPGEITDGAEPSERIAGEEERRQQAWGVARRAAHLLHEQFDARKVVVFGSVAQRTGFTRWSDIDLAAWGIPPDQFYKAVAAVTGLSAAFKVDLIDPDTCRPAIRAVIEREGIVL